MDTQRSSGSIRRNIEARWSRVQIWDRKTEPPRGTLKRVPAQCGNHLRIRSALRPGRPRVETVQTVSNRRMAVLLGALGAILVGCATPAASSEPEGTGGMAATGGAGSAGSGALAGGAGGGDGGHGGSFGTGGWTGGAGGGHQGAGGVPGTGGSTGAGNVTGAGNATGGGGGAPGTGGSLPQGGSTGKSCAAPTADCSPAAPYCSNLQIDGTNCGACGHQCLPGQSCQNGACTGYGDCAGRAIKCSTLVGGACSPALCSITSNGIGVLSDGSGGRCTCVVANDSDSVSCKPGTTCE